MMIMLMQLCESQKYFNSHNFSLRKYGGQFCQKLETKGKKRNHKMFKLKDDNNVEFEKIDK